MQKSSIVIFVILAMVMFVGIGCLGKSKAVKLHEEAAILAHEYQKPIMIRTSENDNRPKWTHIAVSEGSGKVYFSGAFTDGSDYALSIRCANSEALKTCIQAISQYIGLNLLHMFKGQILLTARVLSGMYLMGLQHFQITFMFRA
jgi:hypothetical protein